MARDAAGGVGGRFKAYRAMSWDTFLRGTDKSLRIAALGFFIGMAAAGVGFLATWAELRWLGIGAWCLGLAGWATGMVGILRGFVMIFRGRPGQ